jgi:RNA polymerase sigma-70 factor (ECF subfamily)
MEKTKNVNSAEYHLIERAKTGDREAFNELFSREQKRVFNLMLQLAEDVATADDLTQEALLQAFRYLSDFRFESSFRTWLSRIAINLFRKEYHRKPKHISICLEKIKIPSDKDHPERIMIKRELQWCILHSLQQHVPKKYRMAVILRDLQNFSYKDIAEILGWSISKTKTCLHRGRQILRAHFINGKCRAFVEDYQCLCEGISEI